MVVGRASLGFVPSLVPCGTFVFNLQSLVARPFPRAGFVLSLERMLRFPTLLFALALAGCGGAPSAPPQPVPKPAPVEPELDPEPPLDDTPLLDVIAAQPTEILLDGKPIGTTPISGYRVEPGLHEVTFVDPEHGNRTMMVELQPGEAKTVQSDPMPPIKEMGSGDKQPAKE